MQMKPTSTHGVRPRPRATRRTVLSVLAASLTLVGAAACDRSSSTGASPSQNAGAKDVTLTITSNSIAGGKNADEADWYTKYVIPTFTQQQKAKGVTVKVTFQPSGVDDEQYKTKVALDLKSRAGADIMALDGIWVGEFAQAGYLKPLTDVAGPDVPTWEGWSQIPKAVQANVSFEDKVYGIPAGTDGRVLYFNKKLFAQAGLPADWQPKSWQDIVDAGAKLKSIQGVAPIQINAGTAMGEATTMQGVLPLLAGAGAEIYSDGKWQGDTKAIREVLTFYKQLLDQGLEDKNFQQAAKGRDQSSSRATTSGARSSTPTRAMTRWPPATPTSGGPSSRLVSPAAGSVARTTFPCRAVAATSSTPTPSTPSRPGSSCSSSARPTRSTPSCTVPPR